MADWNYVYLQDCMCLGAFNLMCTVCVFCNILSTYLKGRKNPIGYSLHCCTKWKDMLRRRVPDVVTCFKVKLRSNKYLSWSVCFSWEFFIKSKYLILPDFTLLFSSTFIHIVEVTFKPLCCSQSDKWNMGVFKTRSISSLDTIITTPFISIHHCFVMQVSQPIQPEVLEFVQNIYLDTEKDDLQRKAKAGRVPPHFSIYL